MSKLLASDVRKNSLSLFYHKSYGQQCRLNSDNGKQGWAVLYKL